MSSSWRINLIKKDEYVREINFEGKIMNDQYDALTVYADATCNGNISLALQKCLFFGINDTLEKFSQVKNK